MKEIKIDSIHYQLRKTSKLPTKIYLNREVSWMIGFWLGDNWSSRDGTVTRKNGKRSSGRFGIISNDEEVIKRFLQGLRNEFKQEKVKIDAQIPRDWVLNKEELKKEISRKFNVRKENVNVYYGSPWRKRIGFAVYVNNTALLRAINEKIFKKLLNYIREEAIDVRALLQGIVDSEGDVDKLNRNVGITNKDEYITEVIKEGLKKLKIPFSLKKDKKGRNIIEIRSLKNFSEIVGFFVRRKQMALLEMLQGNFMREKDKEYFEIFKKELKKGTSAKKLSEVTGIPYSTVKLVLRNLVSGKLVKKRKVGKKFIYYTTSSTRRTKRETALKNRHPFALLVGNYR